MGQDGGKTCGAQDRPVRYTSYVDWVWPRLLRQSKPFDDIAS